MSDRFLFQGNNKYDNYFEGWYVKCTDPKNELSIALIPGVAHFSENESFIQYNISYKHSQWSGKLTYPRSAFDTVGYPETVLLPNVVLSEKGVKASLDDGDNRIRLNLSFGIFSPVKQSFFAPTIMGPLEYVRMPCSHNIVSMNHKVTGWVYLNGERISVQDGRGYIEKDRGHSFPSRYVWAQCNHFKENPRASLFLAVALLEKGRWSSQGNIAVYHDGEKEHRFASYLGTKATVCANKAFGGYTVQLKNSFKTLSVSVKITGDHPLVAPMNARMDYIIKETIQASMLIEFSQCRGNSEKLSSNYAAAEKVNWV
ncbi:hypothetical protein ADIAL_2219 [Alkalibacterium sp. AK22]|uniref:tocopherol cyclase family protein n=1 Tax=Alkalibacterium sp. AK22 TaxID=1229520 RepID=UPI00044A6AE5|nr:tocopherol cyclase family protein [Alkalibacterium sp. AK22]EXJ22633.1 hypothetical protein ADIAL_2219 [Alkalibacterium sp. AK22]